MKSFKEFILTEAKTNIVNFNGLTFIKLSKNETEETLKAKGGDFFFKSTKTGVTFYKPDKEPFAHLAGKNKSPFFVNASPTEDGKVRYGFSTSSKTEQMLNYDGNDTRKARELAELAAELF